MKNITNVLKKIKHFLENTLTAVLHFLSTFVPKDKNVWVFIGWHRHPKGEIFADNSKYFFLYTSNEQKHIKSIWLAKSQSVAATLRASGYISYYEKSLKGIWYALRASKTVIDAYIQPENFRWSGNSEIIQLTHGRGMKKGGYNHSQPCTQDHVFCTSEYTKSILPEVFTEGGMVYVTGFPRNDIFYSTIRGSEIDTDSVLLEKLNEVKKNNKILYYSPTFRRGEQYADIESRLSFRDLSKWLESNNFYLVISLHPKYRNQKRENVSDRILFIEDSDVYPLLSQFDLFINDYSSIFADELLLNTPMIFFPFDLDEYSKNEGLMFDYLSTMPGPKAFNLNELQINILSILNIDTWKESRLEMRSKYHEYSDGKSSERIFDVISNN